MCFLRRGHVTALADYKCYNMILIPRFPEWEQNEMRCTLTIFATSRTLAIFKFYQHILEILFATVSSLNEFYFEPPKQCHVFPILL